MHEQQQRSEHATNAALTAKMRAITVSREYGSGGGEVARRLAERLGWQLIDHEVVVRLANTMGISEDEAQTYDEHASSLAARLLMSMRAVDPAILVTTPNTLATSEESYHRALQQVVEAAAREGHVVIVGRASQIVLAKQQDVLHVRIIAPLEKRVQYVEQRENLATDAARSRIQLKDRDRKRYLQSEYHQDSNDAHLYDLVLNTGLLDLDSIVNLICTALQAKAARQDLPEDQQGLLADRTRYPGQPGDLRPPVDTAR